MFHRLLDALRSRVCACAGAFESCLAGIVNFFADSAVGIRVLLEFLQFFLTKDDLVARQNVIG